MTYAPIASRHTTQLHQLRELNSSPPPTTISEARKVTRLQAAILRAMVVQESEMRVDDIARIVDFDSTVVPDLPVPGIAFQLSGRWQVHLSASLRPAERLQWVLHELKHVIDHPLRRGEAHSAGLNDADYEDQADLFADLVMNPSRKEDHDDPHTV